MIENENNYNNCEIKKYDIDKTIFEVKHNFSNEILFAISLSEAYKIARLLDLDFLLSQYYK